MFSLRGARRIVGAGVVAAAVMGGVAGALPSAAADCIWCQMAEECERQLVEAFEVVSASDSFTVLVYEECDGSTTVSYR